MGYTARHHWKLGWKLYETGREYFNLWKVGESREKLGCDTIITEYWRMELSWYFSFKYKHIILCLKKPWCWYWSIELDAPYRKLRQWIIVKATNYWHRRIEPERKRRGDLGSGRTIAWTKYVYWKNLIIN